MNKTLVALLLAALVCNGCATIRSETMLTAEGRANTKLTNGDKWLRTVFVILAAGLACKVIMGEDADMPIVGAPSAGALPKCGPNENPYSGKCTP